MEEDALNQPTAQGRWTGDLHYMDTRLWIALRPKAIRVKHFVEEQKCQKIGCLDVEIKTKKLDFAVFLHTEADRSLHMLSESACGSVVVYVIPESSALLSAVRFTVSL